MLQKGRGVESLPYKYQFYLRTALVSLDDGDNYLRMLDIMNNYLFPFSL